MTAHMTGKTNNGKRRFSLKFKLTAAFLAFTLLLFSLIGIFVNFLLEKQFENYVIDKIAQRNSSIVSTLETRYTAWGGKWDTAGLENIGVNALGDSLMLRVSDTDGTVLWDAMTHNSGMCATMLQDLAENMKGYNAGFAGGYEEKTFPLTVGQNIVGSVSIGYYGPYYYTDNDINFLNSLNQLLLLATLIAAAVSFVFGAIMARRLSSPISRVIHTAGKIAQGKYEDRIHELSNTTEIVELTQAINILAETLAKQESLRKRLTADVAHELRTPTANLQSHIEAMIDGVWELDVARLESCHEETIRISKLVSDLENLARFEADNLILKKEDFDLARLISKIETSFESDITRRNIHVTQDISARRLTADEDKIEQILVNLISNALKYTPDGGSIEIRTAETPDSVVISIKDSGIGISSEDLPYIFERFYRADKSRSRATGGSGIGLAIVKFLAEAHGGTVTVESRPGEGSEFTVAIPRVPIG
ncbi:MAG: ATP-binding protein [Eubacteriales bacterium]